MIINEQKFIIPSRVHLVGICGIGMSGLAQCLRYLGCEVSGSDRSINSEENKIFTNAFKKQGINLFPQDGSFAKFATMPEFIIYSTAIEKDNPDFLAAPHIPKIHRSEALSCAIRAFGQKLSIAITGSAGKTTVTGWISELLANLGEDPVSITGGIVNSFQNETYAGNFRPGKGKYIVFEADESDKSLSSYSPDYSIILNIGTDHYSKEELADVFNGLIERTKVGVICEDNAYKMLNNKNLTHANCILFGTETDSENPDMRKVSVSDYKIENGKLLAIFKATNSNTHTKIYLPSPGFHTALNASAVLGTAELLNLPIGKIVTLIPSFKGVWRRFDYAGELLSGAKIYDDYAHNVEKISNCIRAAQELTTGKVIAVFQPHGYGPLGFMREKFFEELEKTLHNSDYFIMLPVFYAGGTSSFTPKSEEVIADFAARGKKKYLYFSTRNDLAASLNQITCKNDIVLIMGARDNSLSTWARNLSRASRT